MLAKTVIEIRIKALRHQKEFSQEKFGASIDLTRSVVSQIESGQTYPSLDSIDKIVKRYALSWDSLMTGTARQQTISEPTSEARAVVTTVDNTGKDNILLVPVKAQAGYLLGAQQPEYIERLPAF